MQARPVTYTGIIKYQVLYSAIANFCIINMNPTIHITYILSDIDKALAFEWISSYIDKERFQLSFILLNREPSYLKTYLENQSIPVKEYLYTSSKQFLTFLPQISKDLKKWNTQVVHTHLFKANLVGLISARWAGIKKRIHTRHHATYHHVYAPKAVKYDRMVNYLSTDIIAISENVRNILSQKEGVSPSKIHLVEHGFDLELFSHIRKDAVCSLRAVYNPGNRAPVIGVISRYIHWKGIQDIIPAFKRLLQDYPNALLLLANANGPYKKEIQTLLKDLPENSYCEIAFEKDIASLYHIMDVFVHVPVDPEVEAFGQIYVEALAAGIPSVFTLSGVAPDFIRNSYNALTVDFQHTEGIFFAIKRLIENDELKRQLVTGGRESVKQRFSIDQMVEKLQELYSG